MNCSYTEDDAQRFVNHLMSIEEEIVYAKHLSECEICQKRVEDYSILNTIVFFDVEAPDIKKNVYKKIGRSRSVVALLMASIVLSMILFGSHLVMQSNTLETNMILQALNNSSDNQNIPKAAAEVPAYMETSYSYGNW